MPHHDQLLPSQALVDTRARGGGRRVPHPWWQARDRRSSPAWAVLLSCLVVGWTLPAVAAEMVTLQLKWSHQFQFAGYYAAIEQGYYHAAGLDVRLLEARQSEEPTATVLEGKADFGVGTSDLLLLRSQGQPVVVLAVIFQHSPLVLLARKSPDIQSLHDLKGKRVMIEPGSAELFAYLRNEGIPIDQIDVSPHTLDTAALMSGEVVAMSAYSTDEPFAFYQAGVEYHTFSPRSGGIDFYGDNLFTTEEQIRRHPERVRAFLEASLAGWKYAMEHPDEIVEVILQRYSQRKSRAHLFFEAEQMRRLIFPELIESGYMHPGRWRHIADTYAALGMLRQGFPLTGLLYNRNPQQNLHWLYLSTAGAVALTLVVSGVLARFYTLNHTLQRQIHERELAEANLRASEERYRTLVEVAPFPVIIMHLENHTILYMNPRAVQVLNMENGAGGRSLVDYCADPTAYTRLLEIVHQQGQAHEFEICLQTGSDEPFWASLSATITTYQNAPAIFIAFDNITARKRLENELRRLADIDVMTGINNRRHFMELAQLEEERCRRYGHSMSILMLDIDHFKKINDAYGHAAGDEVLRQLTAICVATLRQHDVLGRLGGEEFAAFLPETDLEGARITAERLRSLIADLDMTWDNHVFQCTVSIGATLLRDQEDFDIALRRTDQALYEAKARGRNQVVVRE